MGWIRGSSYWIGAHELFGLVIIDSANYHNRGIHSVFLVEKNRQADFINRDIFKDVCVSPETAENAINALIENRLDSKHKQFLSSHGRVEADIRKRFEKSSPRYASCFHCRKHLNSNASYECTACGWILCDCGACGCTHGGGQFKSSFRSNSKY